ncbi:MAG: hypothetical protein KDA89_12245, partial [Planctomycetaceae bacterium]|nr:hypothetical protein [Planctomycetaceae bacterium]
MKLTTRQWLLGILLIAFGLRLIAAFAVEHYVQSHGRQFLIEGDAAGYWELAQKIASGDAYEIHQPPRRILRTPGFPLLLAAIIRIAGPHVIAARVVLALIGAANCWLTWRLARSLFLSRNSHEDRTDEKNQQADRIGLLAASLVAVSPLQVGNCVLILSEEWFAFWLLLSLWPLAELFNPHRPKRLLLFAVAAGLATATAVLVRPGWLPWCAPALLIICLSAFRRGTGTQLNFPQQNRF